MGIFSWIIFGLIAGVIAKYITPDKEQIGLVLTIILGIIGAVLGGWIGTLLGYGTVSGFNVYSFFIAVVGAVIVLFAYRSLTKK